jgi:hypothetical protein
MLGGSQDFRDEAMNKRQRKKARKKRFMKLARINEKQFRKWQERSRVFFSKPIQMELSEPKIELDLYFNPFRYWMYGIDPTLDVSHIIYADGI